MKNPAAPFVSQQHTRMLRRSEVRSYALGNSKFRIRGKSITLISRLRCGDTPLTGFAIVKRGIRLNFNL